jgi:hypothetical protein
MWTFSPIIQFDNIVELINLRWLHITISLSFSLSWQCWPQPKFQSSRPIYLLNFNNYGTTILILA